MRQALGPFAPLLLPAAAAFGLLFALPALFLVWLSVSEPALGFANYIALISSAGGLSVFRHTLYFALISTIISVSLAYLLAYVISHTGDKQRASFMLALVYSLWVSALIRALAWLILLTDRGILNGALMQLGVTASPLRMAHSDFGVVVGMVHFLLPVCALSLIASFRGIDRACVLAARGLGAGPVRAFTKIFLPMSVPGLVGATSLVFVLALGFYIVPSLLGGGRRTVVAEFISNEVLDHGNRAMPSAAGVVLAVLTILIIVVGSRAATGRRAERA